MSDKMGISGEFLLWPKKKFRWMVQFFKDGVAVRDAEFVKMGNKPPPSVLYPENTRFELIIFNLWRKKGWEPEEFNQVEIKLFDGMGNLFERWLLKDAKFYSLDRDFINEDESDEEELFTGIVTFGPDIEYKSEFQMGE
jgi:hypothetical protein